MSIEVRQLLIRSQVTPAPAPPAPALAQRELLRLREQLLARGLQPEELAGAAA